MIVGAGMMASAFRQYATSREVLVFASGTANSLETSDARFRREFSLLEGARRENPEMLVVYFSTCSIADPDRLNTPYVQHKLAIEDALENWGRPYLVLRLPVVIGRSNHTQTLPFIIRDRILSAAQFSVWTNAVRYPIDIDDAVRIGSALISDENMHGQHIDVALQPYTVPQIVHEIEELLDQTCNTIDVIQGGRYVLDVAIAHRLAKSLGIRNDRGYLKKVLRKYFSPDPNTQNAIQR